MAQTQQVKIPLIEVFADAFAAALARHGVVVTVEREPRNGAMAEVHRRSYGPQPTGCIPSTKPNGSGAVLPHTAAAPMMRITHSKKVPSNGTPQRFERGGAADGRRLPAETLAEAKAFVNYVAKHPGQNIREIGAVLKTKTADLVGPVAKALKLGLVRKEGERSLTKYFPAKKK